jgi:hypothetical protein
MTTELTTILESSGVELANQEILTERFKEFFAQADEWAERAEGLVVTSVTQKKEMKDARVARLALKGVRVAAENTRKDLKEKHIKYNKAVQAVYYAIEKRTKPIEDHLFIQEKYAETVLNKQKDELQKKREDETLPYQNFIPPDINFRDMKEEDYQDYLITWTRLLEEENAAIADRKRLREEKKKLKEEQEALEKEKEDIAKAEEKKKLQQDRADRAIEIEKEKERIEAIDLKKKKAAFPDKKKLMLNAEALKNVEFVDVTSEGAVDIMAVVVQKLGAIAEFIEASANEL